METHIHSYLTLLLLWFSVYTGAAQERIVTLGNTADAPPSFFVALHDYLEGTEIHTTVVLTGDFISDCSRVVAQDPVGFSSLEPLLALIEASPAVEFYLIPGDRDWDQSGPDGWQCVQRLEDFFEDQDLPNLHWKLDKGCPGPEMLEISNYTNVILVSTQWWNHPYRKPVPEDADCKFAEPSVILEELNDLVEENRDKNMLIAGHYPLYSQGRYGGEYPVSDYLFPPLWGGMQTAYRQNVGRPEEIHNTRFSVFRTALEELTEVHEGLVFLSSHEPNQQLVDLGRNYLVNSGAPGEGEWVAGHKPAIFTSTLPGFCVIDLQVDGRVEYTFNQVSIDSVAVGARHLLFDRPCIPAEGRPSPPNPNYQPCMTEIEPASLVKKSLPVDTSVIAGEDYRAGGLKRLFFGAHYRTTWTEPVRVPVLDIDTIYGGIYPTKRGGGRQTKSLKLRTDEGRKYVFRSVDKDPAGALNLELRNTVIADITRDQTSTQHPFGAVPVSRLLDEISILHARPEVYILGDIPRLGRFREQYGNMLGMLEIRPQDQKKDLTGTFGADNIYKSFELFNERYDDQDLRIDTREFVRARIFDLLIGDWSKHEDNWKWAGFEMGDDLEIVRPIPRDRDHAFSQMDGLFPWLASRQWAVANLEHFGFKAPDIRSLTFQARHMDRVLLSELAREDFIAEAAYIQKTITPAVIDSAINTLPQETIRVSGVEIGEKLKERIQHLTDYAAEYYALHARYVDVVGSNKEDHILLTRLPDGQTQVRITDPKGDQKGRVLYERTFKPDETREIRVYGLGDKDFFELQGTAERAIPVRIIGGPGKDRVLDQSTIEKPARHTFVYERDAASADIQLSKGGKQVHNWRDEIYYYHRDAYEYNTSVPTASLNFTSFSGVTLGMGLRFTRRTFTRRDYSSKHQFSGALSTLSNFSLRYEGDWQHVLQKWDLLAMAELERPAFRNFFFGIGNDTQKDQQAFGNNFYLVQLQHYQGELGLRYRFLEKSTFQLRMGYEHNRTTDTEETILDQAVNFYGEGALGWSFLKPVIELDFRDHPVFPSRGFRLQASQEWAAGSDVDFGVSKIAGEVFFSTRRYPITLATRVGWAATQGRVPFYKLPGLGMQEGLRGYQRFRFNGDGYFYYNLEARCPVAFWRNSFIPVVVGVRAFYDSGFVRDATLDKRPDFKQAYGGGFYIIPLSRSYTLGVLFGFSEEETALVNLSLGTNF